MNPSGFFSSEQLDFIFKEAVSYYENNKFTILTQPVTNKILIMLLEALRKDLQYYFNEDYVAKFLQQIALEFKSKAMITDPNRWNPYLANQQRNPDYDPYFITNINAEKIKLEDAVQQFEGLLDQSALDGLLISALQTTVPKEISSLLSAIYKYVKNGFIEMYQDAKAMLQTFADLPEMYNAFLVGLYNGLIRFLASLIEMVGFFVSLANPGNWESFVEGFKKFFSEFWSTLKTLIAAYFKKFTTAQNPVDFIKIFVEEITGIAIELFLLYVSLGASAAKKLAEGLERLLKNPKATVEDWMDYFKKRKKEDVSDTNKSIVEDNRKKLKEKYSENITDGDTQLLKKVENEIKSIDFKDKFSRFESKADELFNKKADRKITLDQYIKKVKTLIVNKEKGKRLEELFLKLNKGIKPDKATVTVHTKRFVDNVIKNTGRELKSGYVKNTTAFQKQFKKDVDIMFKEIDDITKYEWHCFGGISDDALEWALDYANKFQVSNRIKFIIY